MFPIKNHFHLPEGLIYLDGNSLGPLPKGVDARLQNMARDEWGAHLIKGWNVDDWMGQPSKLGDRVGAIIGAPAGTTVLGDTLSLKVFQALAAAVQMRPDRRVILSDTGNFPTDLYMAEGLIAQLGQGHELRLVAPEEVEGAISDEVCAVLLTQVDYRTGRLHDMGSISAKAKDAGAVMIWDLAHSAGAIPVDIAGSGCEFAVGCTYKYLNGGPGAPAFIYVRSDIAAEISPMLSGWLGHDAPFAFEPSYRPAQGIERFRIGTPPVLQMAALEGALQLWDGVDMEALRARSIALCELFIAQVEQRCPELTLASPREAHARGSQVSFRHSDGYAVMQALISRDVIGDFRAPDIVRFGITPLYIDEAEIMAAVDILAEVLDTRLWDQPQFKARSRVT